jgi:hypothetical protein
VTDQFAGELVEVSAFEVIKLVTVDVEIEAPTTMAMRRPLLSNIVPSMRRALVNEAGYDRLVILLIWDVA